jgi:hypothetical protein
MEIPIGTIIRTTVILMTVMATIPMYKHRLSRVFISTADQTCPAKRTNSTRLLSWSDRRLGRSKNGKGGSLVPIR